MHVARPMARGGGGGGKAKGGGKDGRNVQKAPFMAGSFKRKFDYEEGLLLNSIKWGVALLQILYNCWHHLILIVAF
jgi:hypothetical protein